VSQKQNEATFVTQNQGLGRLKKRSCPIIYSVTSVVVLQKPLQSWLWFSLEHCNKSESGGGEQFLHQSSHNMAYFLLPAVSTG